MKMSRRPNSAQNALLFLLEPYRSTCAEPSNSDGAQMVISRHRQHLVPLAPSRRLDQVSIIEAGIAIRQMGDEFDRSQKCKNMAQTVEADRDLVARIINFTASCFPCCIPFRSKLPAVKGAVKNEPD